MFKVGDIVYDPEHVHEPDNRYAYGIVRRIEQRNPGGCYVWCHWAPSINCLKAGLYSCGSELCCPVDNLELKEPKTTKVYGIVKFMREIEQRQLTGR